MPSWHFRGRRAFELTLPFQDELSPGLMTEKISKIKAWKQERDHLVGQKLEEYLNNKQ